MNSKLWTMYCRKVNYHLKVDTLQIIHQNMHKKNIDRYPKRVFLNKISKYLNLVN